MSLTTSCGLREKLLLCAICSHVCPKESGALTVIQWPCVFFHHRDGVVHMTTVKAAALRRADIFCVERPDVDVVAAQMLLEYQDKCARIHMCTRPQTFKAVPGQLLRVMFLSAIIRLTLKMVFSPSLPGPRQFPAALANSDGDAGADCVWVHWPEGSCLFEGGGLTEKLLGLSTGCD